MPELPEVETTRRGIQQHIEQQVVTDIIIRQPKLRWPITPTLASELINQQIEKVIRRGKYLLLQTKSGTVIIHLGMSGSLRILSTNQSHSKHDHVDIIFKDSICLRYNDPRRFGCFIWTTENPFEHSLLKNLGPEPLLDSFDGDYLYEMSRGRNKPVKLFIMDGEVVVGVGNIYANEALFLAGINPQEPAGRIGVARYHILAMMIKYVLNRSIEIGGTTIRNFSGSDGKPGYFKQQLKVYGRGGLNCISCNNQLTEIRLGQRTTVYCSGCQR